LTPLPIGDRLRADCGSTAAKKGGSHAFDARRRTLRDNHFHRRTIDLLSAGGENNEIRIVKREDGSVVGSFGRNGRNAGQFHWVHAMAVDKLGNVYTAKSTTPSVCRNSG
jgi:hypothetical protein